MSLKKVVLALDSLDPTSWTEHQVPDLCEFLVAQFGDRFPDSGRIYHETVALDHDCTPYDELSIGILAELPGPFYVVVYPGFAALPYIFAGLLAVAAYVLTPSVAIPQAPSVTQRNSQVSSPNNDLSERTNRPRINGRIPDIYGTVRSTPDLVSQPYKVFENNREVEYALMCIGRGSYYVDDIRDGDTLCYNIPGTSVAVWDPYTSPNSDLTVSPAFTVGQEVRVPVYNTRRSNSVNGQVLRPPNNSTFTGSGNVRFRSPNIIELFHGTADDFTKLFVEGDSLAISGATLSSGVTSVTETISCQAANKDKTIIIPQGHVGVIYTYDCDYALMFDVADQNFAVAFFTVGSDVTLTQVSGPSGIDLSGTYEVASAELSVLTTAAKNSGVPLKYIVKLVDPVSVNGDWASLNSSDYFQYTDSFVFDVQHPSSAATFDLDLDDTYTVVSVTKETIVLDDPSSVNSDWDTLDSNGGLTPYLSPTLTATGEKWVGPYVMTDPDMTLVFANFIATNGLYKDNGTDQFAVVVTIEMGVTPVDDGDSPIGDEELFTIDISGSDVLKETTAVTLKAKFSAFFGRCQVRARRTTATDTAFTGTVVDEVRWRDAYSVSAVEKEDFGNVTLVSSVTFATASALAVKERKLNMLVSRGIPYRIGGNLFSAGTSPDTLTYSSRADAILVAVCRDQYLGNRDISELDVSNIYETITAVETYFGHSLATEFNYTFDNDNLSFEEIVTSIAEAVFCIAYRRGNQIKLSFEKATSDSTLLFNHRNKIPRSEKRNVSFGYANDNDGLEYTYVDPNDDSIISIFLPLNYAATNPKKVESIGVRNHLQAYFQAWRAWNKILYQNTSIEFDATQEADLLVRNDRILVTDSTRANVQDGEVIGISGLELTLSQVVDLSASPASYTIFLQHKDGTVESLGITAGSAPNKVVLDGAPAMSLVTDPEGYTRTGYLITWSAETQQTAFLVSEKSASTGLVSTVRGYNYDSRYYEKDQDYNLGNITEDGYGRTGGFTGATGTGYQTGSPQAVYSLDGLGSNDPAVITVSFGSSDLEATFTYDIPDDGNLYAGVVVCQLSDVDDSPGNGMVQYGLKLGDQVLWEAGDITDPGVHGATLVASSHQRGTIGYGYIGPVAGRNTWTITRQVSGAAATWKLRIYGFGNMGQVLGVETGGSFDLSSNSIIWSESSGWIATEGDLIFSIATRMNGGSGNFSISSPSNYTYSPTGSAGVGTLGANGSPAYGMAIEFKIVNGSPGVTSEQPTWTFTNGGVNEYAYAVTIGIQQASY